MEEKLEAVTKNGKTIEDQSEIKKESTRLAKQVGDLEEGIILGRSMKT